MISYSNWPIWSLNLGPPHSEHLSIAQIKQTNSQCVSSVFFLLIANKSWICIQIPNTTACMQYITKPTDTRMKTKLNN